MLKLDTGELLVIHLRMSGQLLRAQAKDPVAKHTHVVMTFTQGGQLRFVDPRTFGELFITAPDELTKEVTELADLGMDPVDEPISWVKFREHLLSRTTKLKPLLMDQSFLAGLGNIYSDEILWEAGLRHDRMPQTLSTMEIRRLYRAIVEVLHEAVKHRGSTLSDEGYVDLHGRPASTSCCTRPTTVKDERAVVAARTSFARRSASAPRSSAPTARSNDRWRSRRPTCSRPCPRGCARSSRRR